jgi:hypothetical protein
MEQWGLLPCHRSSSLAGKLQFTLMWLNKIFEYTSFLALPRMPGPPPMSSAQSFPPMSSAALPPMSSAPHNAHMGPPPTSSYQSQPPPSSLYQGHAPPLPPTSSFPGQPPRTDMNQLPNQMASMNLSGPPSTSEISLQIPQVSIMHGYLQGGMPPSSMYNSGPPPHPGMPPPPTSQPGYPGPLPPQQRAQMQGPPSMPGPPSGPVGMPPPPGGQFPPMPNMGGQAPPASPGGQYTGGAPPPPGYGNQSPASMPGQPQQPRRLDPDQMPSPVRMLQRLHSIGF